MKDTGLAITKSASIRAETFVQVTPNNGGYIVSLKSKFNDIDGHVRVWTLTSEQYDMLGGSPEAIAKEQLKKLLRFVNSDNKLRRFITDGKL